MSVSLNVASPSGTPAAGTQGAGAGASASQGGAAGTSDAKSGFQQLLAVLLDLLAAQGGTAGDEASALASNASANQSGDVSLDLGGLLDLKALLASAKDGAEASSDASDAGSDDATTPDPLAAILDVLINALQKASAGSSDGDQLTLDDKSRDALKALNELLASMTGAKGDQAGKAPAPLPSDVIDKLKTLDELLAKQSGDPQLTDLKNRVADLIGRGDTSKSAGSDATTQSVSALLGQDNTSKSSGNAQRDTMVHVLDGAKTNLKSDGTGQDANSGDPGNKNPSSAQAQAAAADQSSARKSQADAGFAVPSSGEASKANQKIDSGTDPVVSVPTHGQDKTQQVQFRTVQAAYAPTGKTVDIPQVAFDIARHAIAGINRFQIRLDPPEMGRIDVRLDMHHEGGITARLTVDRPETYDLLQRDARALERALAQTGLDQGKTNLEFSLRQNPFAGQNSNQGQRNDAQAFFGDTEDMSAEATPTPAPVTLYRGSVRPGGVNLVA